jgi:hypothetical protein
VFGLDANPWSHTRAPTDRSWRATSREIRCCANRLPRIG